MFPWRPVLQVMWCVFVCSCRSNVSHDAFVSKPMNINKMSVAETMIRNKKKNRPGDERSTETKKRNIGRRTQAPAMEAKRMLQAMHKTGKKHGAAA